MRSRIAGACPGCSQKNCCGIAAESGGADIRAQFLVMFRSASLDIGNVLAHFEMRTRVMNAAATAFPVEHPPEPPGVGEG